MQNNQEKSGGIFLACSEILPNKKTLFSTAMQRNALPENIFRSFEPFNQRIIDESNPTSERAS